MATHSNILAWRIPGTEEPGGQPSVGSHRVGHDWSNLACMNALEKEMATHSNILAWRIPGTEEPGGLPSMSSHRVGHDWSVLAHMYDSIYSMAHWGHLYNFKLYLKQEDNLLETWVPLVWNNSIVWKCYFYLSFKGLAQIFTIGLLMVDQFFFFLITPICLYHFYRMGGALLLVMMTWWVCLHFLRQRAGAM